MLSKSPKFLSQTTPIEKTTGAGMYCGPYRPATVVRRPLRLGILAPRVITRCDDSSFASPSLHCSPKTNTKNQIDECEGPLCGPDRPATVVRHPLRLEILALRAPTGCNDSARPPTLVMSCPPQKKKTNNRGPSFNAWPFLHWPVSRAKSICTCLLGRKPAASCTHTNALLFGRGRFPHAVPPTAQSDGGLAP